jgi:hypothetical protein
VRTLASKVKSCPLKCGCFTVHLLAASPSGSTIASTIRHEVSASACLQGHAPPTLILLWNHGSERGLERESGCSPPAFQHPRKRCEQAACVFHEPACRQRRVSLTATNSTQLNCTRIIEMDGASTYMTNPSAPEKEPRSFAFDFSYDWDVRCAL